MERWSREVYLVVKQIFLLGLFFFLFNKHINLGHFILLVSESFSKPITLFIFVIHSTAFVGSYQSSGISSCNPRFPVKIAIYKCNRLNCFIKPMNVTSSTLHLSVCLLLYLEQFLNNKPLKNIHLVGFEIITIVC